jgi:hypothetical protein
MAKKKAKDWKPDTRITVDRQAFDEAMDKLLKAKPVPKKKVKANKARVPEPMFPGPRKP